jgi:hypothetical protein
MFNLSANLFLTGSWYHYKTNKIYFTFLWAIYNFIWIIQDDIRGMNSNCGPSAMKWRTVRPEVSDCPNWRDGLSVRPRRTNNIFVWIWVKNGLSGLRGRTVREAREHNTCFWRFLAVGNGPSNLVGRTVRGSAENHRRAHRRWLRPRFWVGFVSMGS